jgi:sucrose-6-phosphate hydrolase SacC (GH32 family)
MPRQTEITVALPMNASDESLRAWTQQVLFRPDLKTVGTVADPTTGWQGSDGDWRILVACNRSAVCQYKASDGFLSNWSYAGQFAPTFASECPDFYQLPGTERWVLSGGKLGMFWRLGEYQERNGTVVDSFRMLAGQPPFPNRSNLFAFDVGNFGAPKTFHDPTHGGRRIIFGSTGAPAPCPGVRWSGLQSLPRVVTLDGAGIKTFPIPELKTLRTATTNHTALAIPARSSHRLMGAAMLDLELAIPVVSAGGLNLTLTVLAGEGRGGVPVSLTASKAGGRLVPALEGVPFRLDASEETIQLRVVVDVVTVEAFAQGGRRASTAVYCPPSADDTGVELMNAGTSELTVSWVAISELAPANASAPAKTDDNLGFNHPGGWHTADDIRRVRAQVASGKQPWATAAKIFLSDPSLASNYTPRPMTIVRRDSSWPPPHKANSSGDSEFSSDCVAAYYAMIKWIVTRDEKWTATAERVIDAWSGQLQGFGGWDQMLAAGLYLKRWRATRLPAGWNAGRSTSVLCTHANRAPPLKGDDSSVTGAALAPVRLWADFGSAFYLPNEKSGVRPCPPARGDLFCGLSDSEAAFVAKTYSVVSLEKCFGVRADNTNNSNHTMANFATTAKQIMSHGREKPQSKKTQVLFYWSSNVAVGDCYEDAFGGLILDHPEWWLKNSTGGYVWNSVHDVGKRPYIDFTVPEAAAWWVSVPMAAHALAGAAMSGVFADSAGDWGDVLLQRHHITAEKAAALNAAHRAALRKLHTELHAAIGSDALLVGNAMGPCQHSPCSADGVELMQDGVLDGVCAEHFGAFEWTLWNSTTGEVDAAVVDQWLTLFEAAAATNGSVFVKTWPGPETSPIDGNGPSWPQEFLSPYTHKALTRSSEGIAAAAAQMVDYSLATFLCVQQPDFAFSYGWWYDVSQGYLPGADAPVGWYPQLSKPLGKALSPPKISGRKAGGKVPMVCTRDYEGAHVTVDFLDFGSAKIVWKTMGDMPLKADDSSPPASSTGSYFNALKSNDNFNISALASFHPVVPGLLGDFGLQGDTCGGLYHNDAWHIFVTIGSAPGVKPLPGRRFTHGTWAHLRSSNLVDFEAMIDPNEPMGGTGGVTPLPGGGVGSWFNDLPQIQDMETHQAVMGVTNDPELRTWETANVSYKLDLNRSYRDTARPIQSRDGTWWQMIGCDTGGRGAIACAPRVCNAAICQFQAEGRSLNSWEYKQALFTFDKTLFGQPFSFGEVPDFFPMTSPSGKQRHVLTVCAVNKPCQSTPTFSCVKNGFQPGWNPHNVEYVVGDWADDGSSFEPLQRGVLDYGHWYAARTVADDSNSGRRLIVGNVRSDITQGKLPIDMSDSTNDLRATGGFNGGPNFFTSLPRELRLKDNDRLAVLPPKELEALRLGAPVTKTVPSLKCGQRLPIGFRGRLAEVAVTLTYSEDLAAADMAAQAGFYVLSEGVFVGYDVHTKQLVQNASNSTRPPADWGDHRRFQQFVSAPNITLSADHTVSFRTLLDMSFLETFEDKGRAVITSITAPATPTDDEVGLYFDCNDSSISPHFDVKVWRLRPAPVKRVPVRTDDGSAMEPEPDVIWSTPSTNVSGSMPLGNGNLGVNVYSTRSDEVQLLLSHTDSVDETGALVKIGRLVVPQPQAEMGHGANGNWDAVCMDGISSWAVFLSNHTMMEQVVEYYLHGIGNGRLTHYIKPTGQCQESGRDQGHSMMGEDHLLATALTILHATNNSQLFTAHNHRLRTGFEYAARYNLGHDVPFAPNCDVWNVSCFTKISTIGRGEFSPTVTLDAFACPRLVLCL